MAIVSGNALLTGLAANETLTGTIYADRMAGYNGNDTMNGGAGNDTIDGGKGLDRMTGGAGNDSFLWRGGDADGGRDVITDFDQNGNDVLVFTGVGPKAFTYSWNPGGVLLDTNGAAAGGEILLQGTLMSQIDHTDFVFM